jgi:competence protein ComGC
MSSLTRSGRHGFTLVHALVVIVLVVVLIAVMLPAI